MADGQVVFEIDADKRKALSAIGDVTDALEKEGKKWERDAKQSTDGIGNGFSSMFKAISAAAIAAKVGSVLLDWGKAAIATASDLQEVQNVVDVTFGESAGKIDAWAKSAGSSFGLTELQAKQFTSTLGAMMKSSGLAGDEIVGMSTDLAGLAADMASFYNLDFDTAFQKIRSGISGETEPLKQLGVNMSVANLEAYALTQGITKSFDSMTQGEQTMLRYQYLMQATADAQGDFARTAGDSFANMQRRMETSMATIKAKVGELLLPAVSDAAGAIAGFLEKITSNDNRTVLDDFADIDLDTAGKIAEIEQTAAEASALLDVLEDINTNAGLIAAGNAGANIEKLASSANSLQAGKPLIWRSMYNVLSDIDGLSGIFNDSAAGNVSALATALSEDAPNSERAAAWETFLDALGSNAGALNALTGKDADGAAEWLTAVSNALNDAKLDNGNVDAWQKLMNVFAEGLSDENKGAFSDTVVDELLAMGNESEYAREALAALGFESDDIANAQNQWLMTCQRLVQTIPGLSSIINTQTGEVEGGTAAVRDYIDAWEQGQKKLALTEAVQNKRAAIESKYSNLPELELEMRVAEYRVKEAQKRRDEIWAQFANSEYGKEMAAGTWTSGSYIDLQAGGRRMSYKEGKKAGLTNADVDEYNRLYGSEMQALRNNRDEAKRKYDKQVAAYNEAVAAMDDYYEYIDEMPDATEESVKEMTLLQQAANGDADALNNVETAVNNANTALKALADYQEQVRSQTEQTVRSVVSGFEKIETPAMKARNEVSRLNEALMSADTEEKRNAIQKELDAAKQRENSGPSITSMTEGLNSQLTYMRQYQDMLTQAREKGVSESLLASLSDGSQESYDYLYALTQYGGDIDALNAAYAEVQAEAENFTGTLTEQQLAVDSTYQSLVDKAAEAVNGLNMGETAYANVADTLDSIITACGDKSDAIKTAVDGIVEQMNRLQSFGGIGLFSRLTSGGGLFSYGSHANGIDSIPYDGYLAVLHQGERVQTAAEADLARRYSYAQPGFDYASMGGAIGSNIGRGNVYLDGRTVGEVLSSRQASSYRAMERSGYQG